MRKTATEAGQDDSSLEVTRWGSIDMSAEQLKDHVANGTTRLVVSSAAHDLQSRLEEISAFAERFKLH